MHHGESCDAGAGDGAGRGPAARSSIAPRSLRELGSERGRRRESLARGGGGCGALRRPMAMRAGVAVAAFVASLAPPSVRGIGVPASAAPPPAVAPGMKSIGVAVKQSRLQKGVEKVVFEHALSPGATHGVMTEAWHAGKPSGVNPNLRIRYYIDGEASASVDYPLFLAHGTGPAQTNVSKIGPWGNAMFGRSHDSGWYNVRPTHTHAHTHTHLPQCIAGRRCRAVTPPSPVATDIRGPVREVRQNHADRP